MTQTSLEREQNSRATVVIVIILVIVIVIVVVVVHAVRSLSVSRVLFGVYYYLKTPSTRWFLSIKKNTSVFFEFKSRLHINETKILCQHDRFSKVLLKALARTKGKSINFGTKQRARASISVTQKPVL